MDYFNISVSLVTETIVTKAAETDIKPINCFKLYIQDFLIFLHMG